MGSRRLVVAVWRASLAAAQAISQTPLRTSFLGARFCTDWVLQGTVFPPGAVPENLHKAFSPLARGISFRVLVGSGFPPEIQEACCFASTKKLILAAGYEDKTAHAWGRLFLTAT